MGQNLNENIRYIEKNSRKADMFPDDKSWNLPAESRSALTAKTSEARGNYF